MKAKMEKDLRYRKKFYKLELQSLAYKTIVSTGKLGRNVPQSLYFRANLPSVSYRFRIRNRCVMTGRARSYIRFFNLSRIKFRELALKGLLTGVKKSSW